MIKLGEIKKVNNPFISDKGNCIFEVALVKCVASNSYVVFGVALDNVSERLFIGTLKQCRKYCKGYVK